MTFEEWWDSQHGDGRYGQSAKESYGAAWDAGVEAAAVHVDDDGDLPWFRGRIASDIRKLKRPTQQEGEQHG